MLFIAIKQRVVWESWYFHPTHEGWEKHPQFPKSRRFLWSIHLLLLCPADFRPIGHPQIHLNPESVILRGLFTEKNNSYTEGRVPSLTTPMWEKKAFYLTWSAGQSVMSVVTAASALHTQWCCKEHAAELLLKEEEAEFRRQRTQILCRNTAFPGSVTHRTAWKDLSSILLWGKILGLCNKLLQDKCMRILIMKASCSSMLQLIKRSKSWSLRVSWEVDSRAHFIPEKQKWHTAPVPALPLATQETSRECFRKNKPPNFHQQHAG